MKRAEQIVLLLILCAVAGVLRGGYVGTTIVKDPLRADAGQYAQSAENLLEHGTISVDDGPTPQPDSFRSPGYPVLIAAVRAVAGEGWYEAVRWLQVVLGTALVPLTFWLARGYLGFAAAALVAGLVALSPHLVTSTSYVLTETTAAVLLCGGLLALSRRRVRTAGLVFGALFLVNEVWFPLPFLLAPLLRDRRAALGFLLCFGALALPWLVRNQVNVPDDPDRAGSHRAIATMTHGTYVDWVHEDPRYRYSAYMEDPEQPRFSSSWSAFFEIFGARFAERPLRITAWYLFEKPYWLWSWSVLQGKGDVYIYPVAQSLYEEQFIAKATHRVMWVLHPITLVLALVGMLHLAWRGRRGRRQPSDPGTTAHRTPWLVAVPILYATALYVAFAPWPRYSIPLRPELYTLAVWAAVAVVPNLVRRRDSASPASATEQRREEPADRTEELLEEGLARGIDSALADGVRADRLATHRILADGDAPDAGVTRRDAPEGEPTEADAREHDRSECQPTG